uniref:Uncharacterized protein n=1 Tax=Romanomermis culicivorax TaxID=13658 RepID=A0A915HJJ8_ROMCU
MKLSHKNVQKRYFRATPGHSNSHLIFNARLANALASDRKNKVTLLIVQYRPNLTRLDHLLNENVREIRTLVVQNPKSWLLLSDTNAKVFQDNFDYYGLEIDQHTDLTFNNSSSGKFYECKTFVSFVKQL